MPQHQMVIPHYMGRSSVIDINRKISEVNPEGMSRKNSFSSETPPDDIPLLLPHEANGPESSIMDNIWNDCKSSKYTSNEKNGHGRSRSFSFTDDHDAADNQSAISAVTTSESDLQVKDNWSETIQRSFHVKSANEVTEVGPRSLCRCQVSYIN